MPLLRKHLGRQGRFLVDQAIIQILVFLSNTLVIHDGPHSSISIIDGKKFGEIDGFDLVG